MIYVCSVLVVRKVLRFFSFVFLLQSNFLVGQGTLHIDYLPTCDTHDLVINPDLLKVIMNAPSSHQKLDSLGIMYCDALEKGDYRSQANSLLGMANVYDLYMSHPEAIQRMFAYSSRALEVSRKGGFLDEQFRSLEQLVTMFTSYTFYGPAQEYGQQFLELSQKVKDTIRMGEAHMLLGRIAREEKRFADSESLLLLSLNFQDASKKSRRNVAYARLHLANLYQRMGRYEESISQAQMGMESAMFEQSRDVNYLLTILRIQMIDTHIAQNRYDFEELLQEVKVLVKDNAFLIEQGKCDYFEGLLKEREGQVDASINLYVKAFNVFEDFGDTEDMAMISNLIIAKLRQKGSITGGVYSQLMDLLDNLDRSASENRARYLFSSYYYMSIAEKARSEMLELKNQTTKEQLKTKMDNNRVLSVSILALVLICAYLFYLYREKNIRERKLRKANVQLEDQKKEIDHLLQLNNRTLYSKQLKISTIQDSIAKVVHEISGLVESDGTIQPNHLLGVEKKLLGVASNEGTWEEFKHQFEEIHPHFFKKLSELHPNLSINDLKHCSYIISNLKNKEVASLINISPRSVETTRYRLKKKLGLSQQETLYHYLQHI